MKVTKKLIEETEKEINETEGICKLEELDEKVIKIIKLRSKIKGIEQGAKAKEEEVLEIIDSLGEDRDKNNSLIAIKIGEDFRTNSVEWLKEKLKSKLKEEQNK